MNFTYLTTEQLAERIGYEPETIRKKLLDAILLEGVHYVRPFGRRRLLFIWERIEADMIAHSTSKAPLIPLKNGGVARG